MKLAKIISLDRYRAKRHLAPGNTPKSAASPRLLSADRLWGLFDRNSSVVVWLENE